MRFLDIVKLAWQNLCRRKTRTILTAIGVMIGCTSIVVMVSIGSGLDESMEASLASMGDLTLINVYNYSGSDSDTQIDDEMVASIDAIEHVQAASPKLSLDDFGQSLTAGNGRYSAGWANIIGLKQEFMDALGIDVLEGTGQLGPATATRIPVLAGKNKAYDFYDTMRPEGSNYIDMYTQEYFDAMSRGDDPDEYLPDPFFDMLKEKLKLTLTSWESSDEKSMEFNLDPVGILKPNDSLYETQSGMIMDFDQLNQIIRDFRKYAGLPNRKNVYNEMLIKADSIDHVSDVENQLRALGLTNISSMVSMRESMKQTTQIVQLVLGGIGAVALIVAAVGITNTMYMSISERTREIGIMKALGCRTRDIRILFLCEAGMIGLLGGILGAVLSFILSLIINYVSWSMTGQSVPFMEALMTPGNRISVIPVWLMLFGLGFSLLVGLLSGYFPARKAVRIPALEAIKHD